jgi:hypothetical protein
MKKLKKLPAQLLKVILALLSLFLVGCEDFVEVSLPSSQLSSEAVFNDKATAEAAVTEIYAKMRSSGLLSGGTQGISASLGLYADELDYYGAATSSAAAFYNNALLPSTGVTGTWWSGAYNQIYGANAVIEGLEASQGILESDKRPLIGEALFSRALLHFYLLNIYGDIPYITTTDYQVNRVMPRLPASQAYGMMAGDLEKAITLLPEGYVTPDRSRPNRAAAQALLARVFLYSGHWAEASDMASAVINLTSEYEDEPLETSFLKDSRANIWQFAPATEGQNTQEAAAFIFLQGPPGFAALRQELLSSFEMGDLRRQLWVMEVNGSSGPWYHSYKYKERQPSGSTLEQSIVLRLAEIILIRSEARAMQGELIGALEDLNRIRHHAGLGDSQATDQQGILQAVLRERRAELFTEFGHRFFDLKRLGRLDTDLGEIKPGWQSTDALLPIPQNEFIANPSLGDQNPGY